MTKILNKKVLAAIALFGFVALTSLVMVQTAREADAQSNGSSITPSQRYYLNAGTGSVAEAGEPSATTTDIFISTGATASSTIQGQLNRGDQINLFVRALASSSAASLNFVLETSENNVDWYPVDSATSSTDLPNVIASGDTKFTWSLATSTDSNCATNTVCKHITVGSNVYATYFRIRFGITGANAAIHAFAHVRESVGR